MIWYNSTPICWWSSTRHLTASHKSCEASLLARRLHAWGQDNGNCSFFSLARLAQLCSSLRLVTVDSLEGHQSWSHAPQSSPYSLLSPARDPMLYGCTIYTVPHQRFQHSSLCISPLGILSGSSGSGELEGSSSGLPRVLQPAFVMNAARARQALRLCTGPSAMATQLVTSAALRPGLRSESGPWGARASCRSMRLRMLEFVVLIFSDLF